MVAEAQVLRLCVLKFAATSAGTCVCRSIGLASHCCLLYMI